MVRKNYVCREALASRELVRQTRASAPSNVIT
jgi:hypothetical protein